VKDLGVLIPDDTMALQGRIHGKSYQPFRLGLTGSTSEKLANASLRGFYRPELNMYADPNIVQLLPAHINVYINMDVYIEQYLHSSGALFLCRALSSLLLKM
jgi:hypothetical protein